MQDPVQGQHSDDEMQEIAGHYMDQNPHEPKPDLPAEPAPEPLSLAGSIADVIREVAARGCEHQWDILDAQAAPAPAVLIPMQVHFPSTYVLARCIICGVPEAFALQGEWTAAQLVGTVQLS